MIWKPRKSLFKIRRELRCFELFHQIQASLLFPPECLCGSFCQCAEKRRRVVLSLHVELYNQAIREGSSAGYLTALRICLQIPEDRVLREGYADVYPLWLIREELQKCIESREFLCIYELVMILLRLGETNSVVLRRREVSLKEAFDILVGKSPLVRVKKYTPERYFGGEKTCQGHWNMYRSVSPSIAALGALVFSKKTFSGAWPLVDLKADQVEHCLALAYWFRQALLDLETPNVKDKIFLEEEDLLALPAWTRKEGVSVPIPVFEEKIKEFYAKMVHVDPKDNLQRRLERQKLRELNKNNT